MTLPRREPFCDPTIVGLSSRGSSLASGPSSFSSSIPARRARMVSSSATVDISSSQLPSLPHRPSKPKSRAPAFAQAPTRRTQRRRLAGRVRNCHTIPDRPHCAPHVSYPYTIHSIQYILCWPCNSYAYSADQSVPALLIPIRTHPIRTAVTLSVFIDSYSHTVL